MRNERNLGFGCANNVALEQLGEEGFALLINPDAVLEKEAVFHLLEAAERYPDAAILAPLLYDSEGVAYASYKRSVFQREKETLRQTHVPEGDCCAEFLSGAVWLIRLSAFKEKEFFDPSIFLYYEDDDLCLRMRRKGYGLVLVPAARARHGLGKSTRSTPQVEYLKQWHQAWSRLYLERKYRGKRAAVRLALSRVIFYGIKWTAYLLTGNSRRARYAGRLAGAIQFLRQDIATPPKPLPPAPARS